MRYRRGRYTGFRLLDIIGKCGLLSGLKVCVDAGDDASFASGQVWSDVSGQSNHFNLGTTNGVDATDPTFTGTAGRRSSGEYFALDGGDYFTLESGTNPAVLRDMHKAAARGTIIAMVWPGSFAANQGIIGTSGAATVNHGFEIRIPTSGKPNLVTRSAGGVPINKSSTAVLTVTAWNFVGMSFTEAGGATASAWQVNSATEAFNGAATSPSATDATYATQIGASGNGATIMQASSRVAFVAVWDVAVGAGALSALFDAVRGRYSL